MASYQVDRAAWSRMGIIEQMGNIGSEVGRAIAAARAGKQKRSDAAFDRALDLFDATIESVAAGNAPHRLKEVLRAREEFARLFFDGTFDAESDSIERYFAQFAVAARNASSDASNP